MNDARENKNTLISVVLPCFNMSEYIDRSISSLLSQSFADFEIIAIDDGSKDDTHERLLSFADLDSRVKVVKQDNKGLYISRLVGIQLARAEWVTFVDPDDELLEDHLSSLWKGVGPKTGVVVSGVITVSKDGSYQTFQPKFSEMTALEALKTLLIFDHSSGLYPCWNKLYSKNILNNEFLNRERINLGEDQVFNLRVFSNAGDKKIIGIDSLTYRYILRDGSIIRSVSEDNVNDFFSLWDEREKHALNILETNSDRAYFHQLRLQMVMDFFGGLYRSKNIFLIIKFQNMATLRDWQHSMPANGFKNFLRWFKWKMRYFLGGKGYFFKFLE